jgi:hypothetical protein
MCTLLAAMSYALLERRITPKLSRRRTTIKCRTTILEIGVSSSPTLFGRFAFDSQQNKSLSG